LTAGSTKPIAEVRRHVGIVCIERFVFDIPRNLRALKELGEDLVGDEDSEDGHK